MCSTAIASLTAVALSCPLCCQTNFPSVDSLRVSLVSVSSRLLQCPICADMLMGLDKLTIHLFSHTLPSSNSSSHNIDNIDTSNSGGVTSSVLDRAQTQQHWHRAEATSLTPAQNGETARSLRAPAAPLPTPPAPPPPLLIRAQCYLCGCTFRSHELHQMHMQLVHDITVPDALDDDPPSDSDSNAHNVTMTDASEQHPLDNNREHQQQQHLLYQQQPMPTGGGGGGGRNNKSTTPTAQRFECNMCPKSFKLKGSLRVHLRVVHAVDGTANGLMHIGAAADATQPVPVPNGVYDVGSQRQCNGVTSMDGVASTANGSAIVIMGSTEMSGGGSDGGGSGVGGCGPLPAVSDAATKLWECDICAKWFTTKYFLKKHKRLHTGLCLSILACVLSRAMSNTFSPPKVSYQEI